MPVVKLSATGLNRTVVVLDPGHGGTDAGSHIGDNVVEKNVTLALALRLRSLLIARGFLVVLTRDSDAPTEGNAAGTPLTLDDRAGIANHARAAACLMLLAPGRGNGPVDSLTCPAMVLELAPENDEVRSVNDAGYQDRIASAVAGALVFWQNQVQAPPKLAAASGATHTARHRSTVGGTAAGSAKPATKAPVEGEP